MLCQILLESLNKDNEMGRAYSTHGRDWKCIQNSVRKPKQRRLLENLETDEKIILELILRKQSGKVWTGCIWLRIGISGGPL
jgi:hypothetical protein